MFIFGVLVGVAVGFIFKPQLEKVLVKVIRQIKEKGRDDQDNS